MICFYFVWKLIAWAYGRKADETFKRSRAFFMGEALRLCLLSSSRKANRWPFLTVGLQFLCCFRLVRAFNIDIGRVARAWV